MECIVKKVEGGLIVKIATYVLKDITKTKMRVRGRSSEASCPRTASRTSTRMAPLLGPALRSRR